jgi:hypothetical protein
MRSARKSLPRASRALPGRTVEKRAAMKLGSRLRDDPGLPGENRIVVNEEAISGTGSKDSMLQAAESIGCTRGAPKVC